MIPKLLLRWSLVLVFIATFTFLLLSRSDPRMISLMLHNGLVINVSFQLSPQAEAWEQTSPGVYTASGYHLTLQESSGANRSDLKILLSRDDGQNFTVEDFRAGLEAGDPKLYAIWTYNHVPFQRTIYRATSAESFTDVASANAGIPYLLAASRDGTNSLAAGFLSQNRVITLSGQPTGGGTYQLGFDTRIPVQTSQFEEVLYTDTTPENWFTVTRRYADWVDAQRGYIPFPVVPTCYNPMYDIWYWAYDDTNPGLYWTTLVKAKQLGFRSYLFDAGWESLPGEIFKWLEGSTGNYQHPEDKLPGFPGLVQYAKDPLHMNVVFWMSPYAVGRQSHHYRTTVRSHILLSRQNEEYKDGFEAFPMTLALGQNFDENVNLCPRDLNTQSYLKSLIERVSSTYRPNGYWMDFQDTIPFTCEAFHAHAGDFGSSFNESQEIIRKTVLEQVPQGTIELRFPVANLNNKPYANLWQSIDSPEDFDTMRLCTIMMRPFSRGVVMGTDETYWPPETDDVTVSKFVATTVLSGVPAFGANFDAAPRSHSNLVRAWLRFYFDHQEELTGGEFSPFGDFALPNHKIQSSDTAFVYLRNVQNSSEVPLGQYPGTVFLVNCTDRDSLDLMLTGLDAGQYILQVLSRFIRPISIQQVSLDNPTHLQTDVPQGGMVQLTRVR
jgi:hypothetical protein